MNESLNKRMVWIPQKGHTLVIYKFGCAISKMVGPKKQGKKSEKLCWWMTVYQNLPKLYF